MSKKKKNYLKIHETYVLYKTFAFVHLTTMYLGTYTIEYVLEKKSCYTKYVST